MNGLLAIIFLGLSTWTLIALFRRLLRRRVGRSWWGALSFLIACGMGLGIWCALYCEYPVGSHFRFGSFPIPAVVFHLEDGNWVDFRFKSFGFGLLWLQTSSPLSPLPRSRSGLHLETSRNMKTQDLRPNFYSSECAGRVSVSPRSRWRRITERFRASPRYLYLLIFWLALAG